MRNGATLSHKRNLPPGTTSEPQRIRQAIAKYAAAYDRLERLQHESDLIPPGDQKTGCIGEFYAYQYLAGTRPKAILTWGNHSQKGWDIEVRTAGRRRRVQVKTVSAYSQTRCLSPLHRGWNELLVIFLDRALLPRGFWIVTDASIVPAAGALKGCRCPLPDGKSPGSARIPFGENRVAELHAVLGFE